MRVALERALAEAAPQPVADIVADDGGREADGEHDVQLELSAPHEVAREEEDGLLGDGHSRVAEDDEDEDRDIAPVREQGRGVTHPRARREPARDQAHAGVALLGITVTWPSSSRMA